MPLRIAARQARLVVFGYNAVTSKIGWKRSPNQPQYAGMPFSLTGGEVLAYYKDGTASDITDVCSYDPEEGTTLRYAGEMNITASYTDRAGNQFTADTTIEVADVEELVFLEIGNKVQKEGTALDLGQAVLYAHYSDGMEKRIDPSAVIFEPAEGTMIGHMEKLPVYASWTDPATGREYHAQYDVTVDTIEKLYFTHSPNQTDYEEGELLDLTGATLAIKYKLSGDLEDVTHECTFSPENGTPAPVYSSSVYATYVTAAGTEYRAETLLNISLSTISIDILGSLIAGDLNMELTDELPSDFWDGYQPSDVSYVPVDGDYYISVEDYNRILDYLSRKGAFADYMKYGDIPYMVLPAGKYFAADGEHYIEATADIYFIATIQQKDGRPEQLPAPSFVDYPYTNDYDYNQVQVLSFTLNASDYIHCDPGLSYVSYNSATAGFVRKPAGLNFPMVEDDSMYTNYATIPSEVIVNIPEILALPWCWYDDVPHDLYTLCQIVQKGEHAQGCPGIIYTGTVPYFAYDKGSLYDELRVQLPEAYPSTVMYKEQEYVHVKA